MRIDIETILAFVNERCKEKDGGNKKERDKHIYIYREREYVHINIDKYLWYFVDPYSVHIDMSIKSTKNLIYR
jgi:hypothetical protein